MTIHNQSHKVYLCLGSNEGVRMDYLQLARYFIQQKIGPILSQSKIYESESWGVEGQPSFLNQVIALHTEMSPEILLEKTHEIEGQLGRKRNFHWASRTIDIDILLYDNQVIQQEDLIIPHHLMNDRKFVLIPLCDIAAEEYHPVMKQSFSTLLKTCKDDKKVVAYHDE